MTKSETPFVYYKFCPHCGAPLKKVIEKNKERLVCSAGDFTFFQNPKATASALVVNARNEILLTQRAIEPAKGYWDSPGGFVDLGEDAVTALIREMQEELNVAFAPTRCLGAYHSWYPSQGLRESIMNIYYIGSITGQPVPADDVSAFGWFGLDQLPDNLFASHLKAALVDYRKLNSS